MFSPWLDAYALSPIAYVILLILGATVASAGMFQFRRSWSRDALLLVAWAWMGMLLGGFDWLLQNNFANIESIYLGPHTNMSAFVIFMYIIFRRYLAADEGVRQANANLQACLRARETDLLKSHQRLREVKHHQTLSDERQRLMHDMHDGMGSSLITALLAVERGRPDALMVANVLNGCIDDLKLTIDSMEPMQADLLLLLATFRFRIGPRLESAGITLRWLAETVPALEWLDPRNALYILRILQEAFTNIIKHTHATEISLKTCGEADSVLITITDNGQGFAVEKGLKSKGKGLGNQIRRAKSIGAEIGGSSNELGTCLSLRLPIRRI